MSEFDKKHKSKGVILKRSLSDWIYIDFKSNVCVFRRRDIQLERKREIEQKTCVIATKY